MLKTIELTTNERQEIYHCLKDVRTSPYGAGFDLFYSRVSERALSYPDRLREALNLFGRERGKAGLLLIRGIPVEESLRPTPTVPYECVEEKVVGTEKYLLTSASMVGEPIGFADWHQGEKIQNLYPIRELECVQCASNSVYLEIHTETAFRPDTPTHLGLLCLKKDPRGTAKTVFCDLAAVVDSTSAEARRILASPNFCFQISSEDGETFTEPKPIDTHQNGFRRLHYAEALTAVDAESRALLAELKNLILANSIVLELERGDLVFIDNFHVTHGRTAYAPSYDGTDRWLQRVLIGQPVCQTAAVM